MIKINNNSNKVIIVLHEIYGINQHIKDFSEKLAKEGFDVICPNLLERDMSFCYSEQQLAYQYFMENVGFTSANRKVNVLLSEVKSFYKKVFIIGFSIGATVAWNCSESDDIDGVIGFYGSRIRDYVKTNPKCPVLLFFPSEEKSFELDKLITMLNKKDIITFKMEGKHGFGDPYSAKYLEESAKITYFEIVNFLNIH
ncbi:dienelactone hydrolase family protein [Peribacillus acanthi]|uniref:dienelactone hydrolase family protein n=1 Tax=Peribacillus acanthi TaxID=2171554 RepID=UPI000D3ECBD5|nr:dienelactone hydrolase family protein [Peribacillus acanthi]